MGLASKAAHAEIGDFLQTEPALANIDFFIGSTCRIHVTGAGLRRIGKRIKDKTIFVDIDEAKLFRHANSATYESGDAARYESPANEMVLPQICVSQDHFSRTWHAKMLVVHEAVHALADDRGLKILSIRDELAAYIVQAMFLRFYNLSVNQIPGMHKWDVILKPAHSIVDQFKLETTRGVHLSASDIRSMAKIYKSHYTWLSSSTGKRRQYTWATRTHYNGLEL